MHDEIITKLLKLIDEKEAFLTKAQNEAIEESSHHKGAMESRYDTFKEEAQYLMSGLGSQIAELAEVRKSLLRLKGASQKDNMLSQITLLKDGQEMHVLLAPALGSEKIKIGNLVCTIVTPTSGVGAKLLKVKVGDEFELAGSITSVLAIQ